MLKNRQIFQPAQDDSVNITDIRVH